MSSDGRIVHWTIIKVPKRTGVNNTELIAVIFLVKKLLLTLIFDLLLQNELLFEDVITLTLPGAAGEGPDGTKVNTVGKGESQKNI